MGLRLALLGRDATKLEQTQGASSTQREDRALDRLVRRRRPEAVKATVEKVLEELGSIDVLVCNAGTNVRNRSLETLTPEDWDRMIDVNLTGPFNLVHSVLPGMRERKNGLVVQICSISGIRASTLGGAGYSASKFGQAALGMCLGREEGTNGIRSTVIYPGEVNTPILDEPPGSRRPPSAARRSSSPKTSPPPCGSSSSFTPAPACPNWSSRRRWMISARERRMIIAAGLTSRSIAPRMSLRMVLPDGSRSSREGAKDHSSGNRRCPASSSQGYSQLSGRWPARLTEGASRSISLARDRPAVMACRALPPAKFRYTACCLSTTGSVLDT